MHGNRSIPTKGRGKKSSTRRPPKIPIAKKNRCGARIPPAPPPPPSRAVTDIEAGISSATTGEVTEIFATSPPQPPPADATFSRKLGSVETLSSEAGAWWEQESWDQGADE